MINQDWWFTTLLTKQFKYCPPLKQDIRCDVLIVGGGFSGVSAAAEFVKKGLKVVLLEKNILGGSSSGRSAGFLTPDSELELNQLVRRYGPEAAKDIWDAPCSGIERIVGGIKKHNIDADCWSRIRCFSVSASTARKRSSRRRNAGKASGLPTRPSTKVTRSKAFSGARDMPPASATPAPTASIHCFACRDTRTCSSITACRCSRARK
jgi:glycine/D-amino acid oxidase-like deaminating enzyme